MDYSKMINIKREANANDNAFAMPINKKITDTDVLNKILEIISKIK